MGSIYPTSVPSKRLSASISGSASSFQLNNILGWNGAALTSSDFGSKAYGVFRNDANTLMELFEFDPSTIASGSITILLRGLKFTGDLTTEVSANKLTWVRNETIVELGSDVPQLLKHFVDDLSAQTIAGVKTFSSLPVTTAGNPVGNNDLARKLYVDTVVAGIATTINVLVPGTAGETVAAGQLVYFDDTDNEWKLCDADTATTVENTMLGIAQGAGVNGGAISGGVLVRGLDANQSGLTAGAIYYASNTAGGLSASAGTKEVTIGFAYSTTQIYFNPRFDQQLTEDQQDALAGNNGTPSGTNKYMTQSGFQVGAEIYAADAGANDTYVVTLSPVPAAYTTGMVVRFKANTINTGAATLNVNSLGAKTIVKYVNTPLADGDIAAGMFCTVIYDGTNFVLQNPNANAVTQFKVAYGQGTRDVASGTGTQDIAHGMGVTPKMVKIYANGFGTFGAGVSGAQSHGAGIVATQSCSWFVVTDGVAAPKHGQSSTSILKIYGSDGTALLAEAAISVLDATNITLNFTTMTGTGLAVHFQWEAFY